MSFTRTRSAAMHVALYIHIQIQVNGNVEPRHVINIIYKAMLLKSAYWFFLRQGRWPELISVMSSMPDYSHQSCLMIGNHRTQLSWKTFASATKFSVYLQMFFFYLPNQHETFTCPSTEYTCLGQVWRGCELSCC